SILFPLCAWNPVNGDGWALNTYWDEDSYGSFPLFHIGKEDDDFWYVGPVFSGGKDSLGFFPLCYFDYGNDGSGGFVGPVWWGVGKEPDDYQFGFWPLYWHLRGGRHTVLFPLYAYENNEYDQHAYFLSPLLWMSTDYGDENENNKWIKGQYLFLGYWRGDWERHGFFPFYAIDKRDDHFNNVLLWWWDHNDPDCGLFPFAWFDKDGGLILPFAKWKNRSATGMNGEEETWTEGNVLLLGYWGRNAYGFFPFFRGSSSESDMKYIGPLWWAYDEDEREYGFFPFFRVERSQGETNRSYLFPIYSWEKDRFGSEFTSIPFFREDYDYPEYRATTSVHGRRYLIYADHEKKGNRFKAAHDRDDYIPRWGYSPSYLDDVKARMKEDDLTSEEARTKVNDDIASKWEVSTTALHPFFEWTSSNEGERDLRLLFYLFGFDRDKDSSSNWLLWHILFTSGSDRSRDSYGFDRTSSYTNILGVFPYWFRDTEISDSSKPDITPRSYLEDTIELLLRRALMEDGSEESEQWSKDLYTDYVGKKYIANRIEVPQPVADGPFSPVPGREPKPVTIIKTGGLRQIISGIPNEDVFHLCGMDRALSGEMTAKEAEDAAKRLMDVELKIHASNGTEVQTRYGFFPLFGVDRKVREKDGETTPVSTEVITPLTYTSVEEDESVTRILLGILGYSSSEEYFRLANGHAYTEDVLSTLGIIRTESTSRPKTKGYVELLNSFADLLRDPPAADGDSLLAEFWNLRVTAACNNMLTRYARFRDIVSSVTDG
ncbi:MAG: hypothetical protein J6W70_06570, partial [Lentisphaeria bacterium]|nr:hypothetical protein [Lentisphaeria bacterium]